MDIEDSPHLSPEAAKEVIEQYRKVASAALEDAEKWLRHGDLSRAIPEALPDAILVTDESGLIVSVNAQFELMFGYHRSEVLGRWTEILLPEAHRSQHAEMRQAFMENPRFRDMAEQSVLHGRRKNGTKIKVLIRLGPIVIPSGVYTIAIIRKVNE